MVVVAEEDEVVGGVRPALSARYDMMDVDVGRVPAARDDAPAVIAPDDLLADLARDVAPGTLDGGDVMVVGQKIYVGLSSRTNHEGFAQLDTHLSEWGYEVIPVPLTGCLHLKSAVTQVADNLLLINDRWVSPECFASLEIMTVAPSEPAGANALRIGTAVIYPTHHPETAERLDRAGVRVVPVPCTELAKAEGGVTCCSVVFEADA